MTTRFKDRLDSMAANVHAARMAQLDHHVANAALDWSALLEARVSPLAERIARQRSELVANHRFRAMQGHRQLIRSRLRPETG